MRLLKSSDEGNRILRGSFYVNMFAAIVSSLTTSIGSLIDGVIIGQFLGVDSMAAFGLATPVLLVFAIFGAVVASGARNRFTRLVGKGDMNGARAVFTLSMILTVGMSTFMMLIVFIFSTPICQMLGATGHAAHLMEKTRNYLLGISIGLPAMNAARVLAVYMSIDNDRRLPVMAAMVLTIVDIALDVLFAIKGMDTFAMGLATSLSHYAALFVLLTHFNRKDRLLRLYKGRLQWKSAWSMLVKGLPMGVGRVANTARSIILNRILAITASACCIAAYSVHRQADSLLNPFVFGMMDVVIMLSGILVGEENRPMLKRLTKDYMAAIATLILGISILFWFLSPLFSSFFFRDDPEAYADGIRAARAYALGMPFYTVCRSYEGYMQGRGKTKAALWIAFLSDGGYLVLAAFLFLPVLHADAVWYAFPISQIFTLLTIAIMIIWQNRKAGVHPRNFWDWMLALPQDFDVPEEDRIDRTISSLEEIVDLSQAAWHFCDDHGCDEKRKYAISVAVEELATLTILSNFQEGRRNTIDMRILKKGDEYILRIRDDCRIFDPVKQLELYNGNVPLDHIGLQIAFQSAKDVQYTTILKLNNLVLRV